MFFSRARGECVCAARALAQADGRPAPWPQRRTRSEEEDGCRRPSGSGATLVLGARAACGRAGGGERSRRRGAGRRRLRRRRCAEAVDDGSARSGGGRWAGWPPRRPRPRRYAAPPGPPLTSGGEEDARPAALPRDGAAARRRRQPHGRPPPQRRGAVRDGTPHAFRRARRRQRTQRPTESGRGGPRVVVLHVAPIQTPPRRLLLPPPLPSRGAVLSIVPTPMRTCLGGSPPARARATVYTGGKICAWVTRPSLSLLALHFSYFLQNNHHPKTWKPLCAGRRPGLLGRSVGARVDDLGADPPRARGALAAGVAPRVRRARPRRRRVHVPRRARSRRAPRPGHEARGERPSAKMASSSDAASP